MKNRTAILIGSILILVGVFSIVDAFFGINLWSLIFPILLIALGAFIIFRPKSVSGGNFYVRFVNETDKTKDWVVEPSEYLSFVSSLTIDFSDANIPDGETILRMNSFVNDVEITPPLNGGLKVYARGFVHDTKVKGRDEDHILTPFEYETPDYASQTKKVYIQLLSFVSEVEIL